eukprot:EC720323.1.p2 GENE.EC720323.1~~EC720323.1.p2  ORF type:complete len:113 (+),score=17.87 EC720323.1:87-425(+)
MGGPDDAGPKPFVGDTTLNYIPDEGDVSGATFELSNEDHTFGNSIRYVLMRNREVTFCGYSIPHPSENQMNIRLQTTGERPAEQVFVQGLDDLKQHLPARVGHVPNGNVRVR